MPPFRFYPLCDLFFHCTFRFSFLDLFSSHRLTNCAAPFSSGSTGGAKFKLSFGEKAKAIKSLTPKVFARHIRDKAAKDGGIFERTPEFSRQARLAGEMLAFCGTDADATSKLKGIALVPLQRDGFALFGQSKVTVGTPQEQVFLLFGGGLVRGPKRWGKGNR